MLGRMAIQTDTKELCVSRRPLFGCCGPVRRGPSERSQPRRWTVGPEPALASQPRAGGAFFRLKKFGHAGTRVWPVLENRWTDQRIQRILALNCAAAAALPKKNADRQTHASDACAWCVRLEKRPEPALLASTGQAGTSRPVSPARTTPPSLEREAFASFQLRVLRASLAAKASSRRLGSALGLQQPLKRRRPLLTLSPPPSP